MMTTQAPTLALLVCPGEQDPEEAVLPDGIGGEQ